MCPYLGVHVGGFHRDSDQAVRVYDARVRRRAVFLFSPDHLPNDSINLHLIELLHFLNVILQLITGIYEAIF